MSNGFYSIASQHVTAVAERKPRVFNSKLSAAAAFCHYTEPVIAKIWHLKMICFVVELREIIGDRKVKKLIGD